MQITDENDVDIMLEQTVSLYQMEMERQPWYQMMTVGFRI